MSQEILSTIQIRISGEAGDGIITASEILLFSAASHGLEGYVIKNIPSTIEGGYTEVIITFSLENKEISVSNKDDILVILSKSGVDRNKKRINENSLVFIEENIDYYIYIGEWKKNNIIKLPLRKLCQQITGNYKHLSSLIVGIIVTILNFDKEKVKTNLKRILDKKDIASNISIFEAGVNWIENNLSKINHYNLTGLVKKIEKDFFIADGNEIIASGAAVAGCKFYASYPITPATSIGERLTEILPILNGFAYQAEDEIAAIGATIGASFSGVKAMTATSGPGLSLMQEFIGYASMTELPIVIVDVQRCGPSTGMPTRYAQEDLLSAIWGGHGENPHIVLSPVNIEDCFYIILEAFYLAQYFRCPVIVLSDIIIATTKKIIEKSIFKIEDKKEKIFCEENIEKPTSLGLSTPFCITGIEHNDYFFPIETPEERINQIEKRKKKLVDIEDKIKNCYELDMDQKEENKVSISIACWGGLVSSTREAVRVLRQKGYLIAAFYPRLLYPLCKEGVYKWSSFSPLKIVIEANSYAQYGILLKSIDVVVENTLCYYDGEQPSYLKIIEDIEKIVKMYG